MTIIFKLNLSIIILFFICIENECTQNNYREKAYRDMKDFVLNEEHSGIGYIIFFETSTENQITYTSAFGLQRDLHYSPEFKDKDINELYEKIMLGQIILSCENFRQCFNLESTITEEYHKEGFDKFLRAKTTYIEKDNEYIITPSSLSFNEKLSIAYYLYQNNYYTSVDDYSGYFIARKDSLYPQTEDLSWDNFEEIEEK